MPSIQSRSGSFLLILTFVIGVVGFGVAHHAQAETVIQSTVCRENITPTITSPLDDSKTTHRSVAVSGRATPGAIITPIVNDVAASTVKTSADGQFKLNVSLRSGTNQLSVTASICDQSASSKPISIRRSLLDWTLHSGNSWLVMATVACLLFGAYFIGVRLSKSRKHK